MRSGGAGAGPSSWFDSTASLRYETKGRDAHMQIVTNTSATRVRLPGSFSPTEKPVTLLPGEPGESALYDFAGYEKAKPGGARFLRHYLSVREADEAPAVVPAPAPRAAKKAGKRTDEYAALSEPDAAELLAAESDVAELTRWLEVEDRAGLRSSIAARIKFLGR